MRWPRLNQNDNCRAVLTAIDRALRQLTQAHFPDTQLRAVFLVLER